MYEELKKLVEGIPFMPFFIEMSSGKRVLVRSRDHIIFQKRGYVIVQDDNGLFDALPMLHIAALSGTEPAM
jgi:hypothetical protein